MVTSVIHVRKLVGHVFNEEYKNQTGEFYYTNSYLVSVNQKHYL